MRRTRMPLCYHSASMTLSTPCPLEPCTSRTLTFKSWLQPTQPSGMALRGKYGSGGVNCVATFHQIPHSCIDSPSPSPRLPHLMRVHKGANLDLELCDAVELCIDLASALLSARRRYIEGLTPTPASAGLARCREARRTEKYNRLMFGVRNVCPKCSMQIGS